MEFFTPGEQEPEIEIVEDTAYPITFNEDGKTYYFLERWDTLHNFEKLGAWVVKIFDNEDGLVEGWTNPDDAQRIIDYTGTTPIYRETITESEYEGYKKSKGL